jgi:dipeptidyl aminopeptidase/acylaminoacyl peptidase
MDSVSSIVSSGGPISSTNHSVSHSASASFSVETLVGLKRVSAVAVAPCGAWAAVALERLNQDGSKYVSDLWRVALDGSGHTQQLTRGNSRDCAPCFRADGALGFLSNRNDSDGAPEADGERQTQVWLLPVAGEAMRLTDEPLGVDAFKFARSGDCLAVLAPVLPGIAHAEQRSSAARRKKHGPSALHYKAMPVRHWDHWLEDAVPHLIVYSADGAQRRDLTPEVGVALREAAFDVSPDGAQIAVTHATPGSDRIDDIALLLIETASGAQRILAAEPLCSLGAPLFSPDGKTLACTRELRPPLGCPGISLRLIDVASGDSQPCAAAWDRWPVPAAWGLHGDTLLVTADDSASTTIFEIELGSGDITRLTTGGSHSQVQVTPDGSVAGIRSSLLHPPEVFYLPRQSAVELSFPARLSGFDPASVSLTVENLSIISSDDYPVQAYLLKPTAQGAPLPTLLWIHGGPISAWGDAWHWRWCALTAVAQGYAVVLPNPRGSTGFGQAFIDGIWANTWGKQCFEDVMAVADHLAARPDLDADRMAVMGGSFGGYMSNWIGTQTTRFKCLVTHASVYSMSAFNGVTDSPAYWMRSLECNPYTDRDGFDRYSPAQFIANWKTPVLIIHGERDFRVPVGEGLALFEALQFHGVESELLIFPDENHWILKPNNSIVWYQSVFQFLERHLQ